LLPSYQISNPSPTLHPLKCHCQKPAIRLDVLDSPTEKSARGLRSRGGSNVTLPPELFWDKICEPLSYGPTVRGPLSILVCWVFEG
jgi:hypothetical protein